MLLRELLTEAKPENLNQPTLDKLFAAYQNKDSRDNNYKSENGLEVAQHIFSAVGPSYLNWVVKQYANDRHFFLHDLPILSDQINKFVKLTRSPTVTVERDVNKYQSISDLYIAIQSIDKIENVGGKFWRKAISGIKEFVSRNEAKVLYESPQYVIYQPLSFKSSHFLEGIMTTTLCTIMKGRHFKSYSAGGILMYTITQDKMYNCYVATKKNKSSEFSDQHNNHAFDLEWQIKHFPALKPLIKSVANKYSGMKTNLAVEEDPEKRKQICLAAVKQHGWELEFVPKELLDREICLAAVKQNSFQLQYVPEKLLDREMCLAAVKQIGYALEYVPKKLRDREICLTAVKQTGSMLCYVPEKLRDLEICLTAVRNWNFALMDVPEELQDKVRQKLGI